MNKKSEILIAIVERVVECCAMDVGNGNLSVTKEQVLGRSKAENVVMTRCILVNQIKRAGYSTTTAAQLLGITPHAVRHLLQIGDDYERTSRAYWIASAEATIACKDLTAG